MFGKRRRRQTTPVDPDPIWRTLELVNEWIRHAEAKAGATLAGTITVLAGMFALWQASPPVWSWWFVTSAALAISAFLIAAWLSIASLMPRLRVTPRGDGGTPNLLYFNDIATWPEGGAAFMVEVVTISAQPERLATELTRQLWANSNVANKKFLWANRAIVAFTFQIALTVLNALMIVGQVIIG